MKVTVAMQRILCTAATGVNVVELKSLIGTDADAGVTTCTKRIALTR